MRFSVCNTPINAKFCPNCGQKYDPHPLDAKSVFTDLLDQLFSLENSLWANIRIALLYPGKLIHNYWDGFRRYYYSPARFLGIAALLISLNYIFGNKFIYFQVEDSGLSEQFILLIILLSLFSISSYLIYWKFRRNFNEHLVMNMYIISLWTIIFFPVTIFTNIWDNNWFGNFSLYLFLLLIIIWTARTFKMSMPQRILYIGVHILFLGILIYFL